MPNEITTAGTLSTKASKALDTMRGRLPAGGRGLTPTTNRRHDMATNDTHQQPAAELRLGRIVATIWRNRAADGSRFYNAQLSRLYRDGDSWKRTDSFGRDDLLTVNKVADMAHTHIYELQAEAGDPDDAPDADDA